MILKKIADLIWGDWLVALIFVTGIYYTFILKGLQFKKFPYIIKKTFFLKKILVKKMIMLLVFKL